MKQLLVGSCVLTLAIATTVGLSWAQDKEKKITIKQVMKTCMKGGLCKKVASGKGSAKETKQLVKMFQALAKAKPPKGSPGSWKKKTSALVKHAKAVQAGTAGAGKALGKAANCKACHSVHRGK